MSNPLPPSNFFFFNSTRSNQNLKQQTPKPNNKHPHQNPIKLKKDILIKPKKSKNPILLITRISKNTKPTKKCSRKKIHDPSKIIT